MTDDDPQRKAHRKVNDGNVLMFVSKHSRKEISKKMIYTINIFKNIQLMNYHLLNRKNL